MDPVPSSRKTKPIKKAVEPKESAPKKKRIPYKIKHADSRHGDEWPKPPSSGVGRNWTGWLTHREYNLIESHLRYGIDNIYHMGEVMGIKHDSSQRAFYDLEEAGFLEGEVEKFRVTPMAKILFDMTDQYILQLDLED